MTSNAHRAFPDRFKAWFYQPLKQRSWFSRLAIRLATVALVAFAILLSLLRFVVLPQIENYRGDLEHALSAALHLPVLIGGVSGRMEGIRPRLELRNLTLKDASGRPALSLDHVVGVVGWTSLLHWSPLFYLLEIDAPALAIRRDTQGNVYVAGLPLKEDISGPDLSTWLLNQHAVTIRDARLTWTDERRKAAPLTLDHLNLQLEKSIVGHRFGFTALPPQALAAKIDLRGRFSGDSVNEIDQWEGALYGQLAYVDLAAWEAWVDYPVELPRGRGAVTVWLDFKGSRPTAVTADVSLADVQVRLAPGLAMLPLRQLNGRISFRETKNDIELSTRQLSLATADGVDMPPTDLHLTRGDNGGEFKVNTLDFHALAALAGHLPLPASLRQQLLEYAPSGSLQAFDLRWRGAQWPFAHYDISGQFDKLAFSSVGRQPGFSGLSGSIEGDEDSGKLQLKGREATLTLPKVFHQPLSFDTLDASLRWKKQHSEFELANAHFRNADAEGTASGAFHTRDQGLGDIDLDANLTRAEATAVWRYMPLQAGEDVGPFLHAGLKQGKVTSATLKLKGDLDKFPFAGHSGVFRIHGVFHDAALRYADHWPQIDNVDGELDFDGPTMTISARDARILGVQAGPTKAVLPDLASLDEQLLVEGKAAGATSGFLKFIEASPVGEQIDHMTEDMTASGNGELNLKLTLPLRHLDRSQVNGNFRFDDNRLLLDPDMPALEEVRGTLNFSAESLGAKGVTATMFGLPMKVDLKTTSDGSVLATASGDVGVAQLRKLYAYAGLKNLMGSAHWTGTVSARKKSAEIRISSDLVGLSSSLPEPFAKQAKEAMPLLFERKALDVKTTTKKARDVVQRQSTELGIGRALRAQLIYHDDDGRSVFERGLISVGDVAARVPEHGLGVAVFQPRINLDEWRRLVADGEDKPGTAKTAAASTNVDSNLTPNRIDLRSAEMLLMGRSLHDAKIAITRPADSWVADINSREIAARLEWTGGDAAKLSGRISKFVMPEAAAANVAPANAAPVEALKELPNLDLTLDHLALNGHDYGELHLSAENKGGDWNAKYSVKNDDGALDGQGRWRLSSAPAATTTAVSTQTAVPAPPLMPSTSDTQMDFTLHARSIERFLNRVGYPNTVKRGNADLNGHLGWKGAPHEFDFASLNGQLAVDAHDGQFNKLEPGVGRLLGVLSLQSIPRRLTLDFRDVFSEGLAFDVLKGKVTVTNGVMDTQNMEIRGPAAKVQMAGSVDLMKETQDLKVRVQPKLGESVSTGVLLVNPAVGATAWVFNKLFGNPLDSAFAYDFAVTGSWADPKVEKIGAQSGAKADAAK